MRAADQFHVGLVVADLDAALDQLGATLGHEWGTEVDVETPVHLPAGVTTVRFRFRYSRTSPRLEVIQAQPGTPWEVAAGSGIHHLGFWSDDVDADGTTLEQAGHALEAAGVGADGRRSWAYHRRPDGPRIELVDRALEPGLAGLWSGASER